MSDQPFSLVIWLAQRPSLFKLLFRSCGPAVSAGGPAVSAGGPAVSAGGPAVSAGGPKRCRRS
jgi:hypothetical protein